MRRPPFILAPGSPPWKEPRRPNLRPPPPPPAVVDRLLRRGGPTRAAAAGTLIALAARGHLELVVAPSGTLVARTVAAAPAEPLARFEELVLRQVARRLAGGPAPASALL